MRSLSTLLFVALLAFATPAGAQVCQGFNAFNKFATCTDATAANLNVSNATAGLLGTAFGGTHLATFTAAGGIAYSTSASVLAMLGIGTTNQFLAVVGGLPAWVTVQGVANGGLGLSSTAAGALLYGTGATSYASLPAGTSGWLLQSGGAAAPSWVNPSGLSSQGLVLSGQTLWTMPVVGQWGYFTGNNTLALTNAATASCAAAQGIGVYQGTANTIQTDGPQLMFFDNGLTLAAGNQVFLSDVNGGQVTNVAPTTAGHCVALEGYLISATGYVSGSGSALNVATQHGYVRQL